MRVLYVHQYFNTPEDGGCIRSYHLARGLVAAGHEVTMITSHNGPSQSCDIEGIKVHYLQVPYANKFGFIRRIWAYLDFVRQSKRKVRQLDQSFDLAYVMTTPLTTGLIALHLKEVYNIPYYFEVGDLWPEAPIKMGAIKSGFLKQLLYRFEKKCYFEAQKVIALSPAIRNYIEASCPETNVYVVTNIADVKRFEPTHKLQHFNAEQPLHVGYLGTFGAANDLDNLIKVARACAAQHVPVKFTLMGSGGQYARIAKKSQSLANTTVLPFGNTAEVEKLMEQLDVCYVSFKNLEILNTGSPNKFFDGLAAGKLIITNFGGWIRNLIEKNQCGFYHDPTESEDFIRKIREFVDNPHLLHTYQKNARTLAENYYSKELQVQKLLNIMSNQKHMSVSDSEVYILTA
ncbi:glycosyltransferase family 4 protein [Marinoscillum furvescens]|uniref:Glycosyltransferase involved in cell wall biosynthesis n=1 Tax=Marinoscillum furvescens DSM 4134 TaxID=1122208 RepID=A0A3D9L2V0_MARFU|nr:glycosyltransferase family 4 protein [Marinoscillum furvescens]RED98955.1 glycosyltransferase involved in cell wall biosynthesis [Marinoscillum furvescens DSM 4134]